MPADRVALVEFFGVGGTADYTDCLARALAARGIQVSVITSSLFEPLSSNPPYEVVRSFVYASSQPKPYKALQLARAIRPARAYLEILKPDVVHAQGTVLPAVERFFYRDLRAVTVCTVHDARAHERRPLLGSFAAFYRRFDQLICHSESTRHQVEAALPNARVAVVPHGRYSPLAGPLPAREAARLELKLPREGTVALFFGFIRPYKGLELFLDALRAAHRNGQPLVGLIAGRPLYDVGPSIERAQRDGLPLASHLRFIRREEIARFFAAADIVALPYVDTSDSGAFELAAAFRRPVVVTDAGGLPEAFARYGYGRVLPERNAAALAEALLASYPEPLIVAESNSWARVAAQTELVYQQALRVQEEALVG